MLAAKDVVVNSPFSPANLVSHAVDEVVDGTAVLDFFRNMVLKSGDDVIKDAPAAARMGSELAQGAGGRLDDMARPARSAGAKAGNLADKVEASAACMVGRTNSFVPGTLVVMADGSRKPIEQVQQGDRVLATDPTTGRTEAREVTDARVKESLRTLVEITVVTASGEGKITATDEHPFWVESEKRWVEAIDLKAGQRFLTADNRPATVGGTRSWSGVQKVHNLTVDGLHTYFVTSGAGKSGAAAVDVLTHNSENRSVGSCATGHIVEVSTFGSSGDLKAGYSTWSGQTSDAEKAIENWRIRSYATHTKNRVGRMSGGPPNVEIPNDPFAGVAPVDSGDAVVIEGTRRPCSHRKKSMRTAEEATGASFVYLWPGEDGGH